MKKKILALCLVVVLAVTAVTGVTLAYFTDTAVVKNTFTAGSIDLKLDEAVVEKDENDDYVADDEGTRTEEGQAYDLHPGQTILKDPTLYLTTTEEYTAYMAAKVVIDADLSELYVQADDAVNFYNFVSGGVTYPAGCTVTPYSGNEFDPDVKAWEVKNANGHDYYLTQEIAYETVEVEVPIVDENNDPVIDEETGKQKVEIQEVKVMDSVTMCYYFQTAQENGTEIVLFDTLKIPADWNSEEMVKLNDMNIDVTGYAVQVESFDDVLDAMSNTFDSELSVKAAA